MIVAFVSAGSSTMKSRSNYTQNQRENIARFASVALSLSSIYLALAITIVPAWADAAADCAQESDPDLGISGCTSTAERK
jgi:hypothetical protein